MNSDKKYVQKLSTGIPGLDSLFYNGIQLTQFGDLNHSGAPGNDKTEKNKGLVIAIRGVKGTHKLTLATQIMQGLTKEIYKLYGHDMFVLNNKPVDKDDKENNGQQDNPIQENIPCLFSLNKDKDNLRDMYLDLLLSKEINYVIKENISNSDEVWQENTLASHLFDLSKDYKQLNKTSCKYVPDDYRENADKYICDRTFYYSSRTNALHFRREEEGDDDENILFNRKSDSLADYCEQKKTWPPVMNKIKEDFFNVAFNEFPKENNSNGFYVETAFIKLQQILSSLAESQTLMPCIVIDGFAQFQDEDLKRVPIEHLINVLRLKSLFSIMIFDERGKEISCNADIIIDMRQGYDEDSHYSFYELQITKSVYQTAALGWHQYKERLYGIEVFPSVHRLMQRRNYLSFMLPNAHQSILNESYEEYLRSVKKDLGNPCYYGYEKYQEEKIRRKRWMLQEMYARQITNLYGEQFMSRKSPKKPFIQLLEEAFLEENPECACNWLTAQRWKTHEDITALIGNPNSFKRLLTNAGTFNACRKGEHTLVILFDKEEEDVCRQTICPGFRYEGLHWITRDEKSMATKGGTWMPCFPKPDNGNMDEETEEKDGRKKNEKEDIEQNFYMMPCDDSCPTKNICMLNRECSKCYENIHFFGVRMGCITADELFAVMKDLLETPFPDGKRFKRVVIDDLQKVDFSFPLLKNNQLFLSALITLFRQHNVKAQILCDKRASLTQPLCSVADNVVCMCREEKDVDKVTIYIEKNSEHTRPSEIHKYTIDNIQRLFICNPKDKSIILNYKLDENDKDMDRAFIEYERIGSMKEYWRTKFSIFSTDTENRDDNSANGNDNVE